MLSFPWIPLCKAHHSHRLGAIGQQGGDGLCRVQGVGQAAGLGVALSLRVGLADLDGNVAPSGVLRHQPPQGGKIRAISLGVARTAASGPLVNIGYQCSSTKSM